MPTKLAEYSEIVEPSTCLIVQKNALISAGDNGSLRTRGHCSEMVDVELVLYSIAVLFIQHCY